MKNSKLLQKIAILTDQEFLLLGKWLNSQWCNTNKKLIVFHQFLQVNLAKIDKLVKVEVFAKLYPNKTYHKKIFNNLISEFIKQIESFIIFQELKKDKLQQQLILKEALKKRKQTQIAKRLTEKLINQKEQIKQKEWEDYLQLSLLHFKEYFQANQSVRYQSNQKHLLSANENLDFFYALSKSRILHELNQRKALLKTNLKRDPEFKHLSFLQNQLNHPAINLYHLRLSRPKDWDLEEYKIFKQDFLKHFQELPIEERQIFLLFAINDTVVLSTRGTKNILEEMFELYQLGLKEALLLSDGFITNTSFINIVVLASSLQKTIFLKSFINQYSSKLPPSFQIEAKIWAKSQSYYNQSNYEKCIEEIGKVIFEDPQYSILSRMVVVKANYEILTKHPGNINYFSSTCLAFEKYMHRNRLFSSKRINATINFIRYAKKIAFILLDETYHQQELKNRLKKKIEKESNVFNKTWLLQKLEEIVGE